MERHLLLGPDGKKIAEDESLWGLSVAVKKLKLDRYVDKAFDALCRRGGAIVSVTDDLFSIRIDSKNLSKETAAAIMNMATDRPADRRGGASRFLWQKNVGLSGEPIEYFDDPGEFAEKISRLAAAASPDKPTRTRVPKCTPKFMDRIADALASLSCEEPLGRDAVEYQIEHYRSLFSDSDDVVRIYRMMRLPEDAVENMSAENSLGCHWSTDFEQMSSVSFYDNDHFPDGKLFLFVATVHASKVDWPYTIAYNGLFPEESEIHVCDDVVLESIHSLEDDQASFREWRLSVNLRPDLSGVKMSATKGDWLADKSCRRSFS